MSARGVDGAPGGTAVLPGKAAQRRHVPARPMGHDYRRALSRLARTFQVADWLSCPGPPGAVGKFDLSARNRTLRATAQAYALSQRSRRQGPTAGVWHESNHQ
ncbi:hypothetical protein LMG23994_02356 [Cupriavidus pinatubonensis]|uniref:Uncharacterized protein n=1 Tax=Cupriavidus pinatubonensis TaxID=248026 RepID=A0ABM8WXS1_9BURK|nr:hypothetical protein LMG23994_02356 [Cupriavidus pinatubonensis]